MNEECPYPPVMPHPPVVEEICFMQAQKAEDFVEFAFDSYGEGNSQGIIECYVEVLKKAKKGDVETMCTKDAIVEGWEKLTAKGIEDLLVAGGTVEDNDKGG